MAKSAKGRLIEAITLFIILATPLLILKEYKKLKATHGSQNFSEITTATDEVSAGPKSFVIVVVPTPQSEQVWERNLDAIFHQRYSNYRVVYLDTGSSERLLHRVRSHIAKNDALYRIQLVETQPNETLFEKYCEIVGNCKDDEVIVHLSGNDWFAHDMVLDKLNQVYEKSGVWLTYGQYLEYPSFKKCQEQAFTRRLHNDKRFEKMPWFNSPLKTYYAKLFKQLNFDEIYQDDQLGFDFMLPMVKMAKRHIQYIPEVLYIHNLTADVQAGP